MRHFKLIGPIAVAVAAVALLGAGPASADGTTVLCAFGGSPQRGCVTDKGEYQGKIETSSTNAVFTTSTANVTCTGSAITVLPASSTGSPISMEVTALSFTGCKTSSGTACTVTTVNLPYAGHLTGTVDGYANTFHETITDPAGAGAQFACGFLINCTFTSKEVTIHGTDAVPTTLMYASNVPLARSGGFCPETAAWDATYAVTSPSGFTVF